MTEPIRTRTGRHRSAATYSPVAEISAIARSAGQTGMRASAVLAASGGLVATVALPATASGSAATSAAGSASASTVVLPAVRGAVTAAPAVTAPEAAAPVAVEVVGVAGVKAVQKPEPVVRQAVQDRTRDGASRSGRSAPAPTTKGPDRPAPEPPVSPSGSSVVSVARGLLGIGYIWGGTTTAGFDCSGFTSYVFRKVGKTLPRTAAQQQAAATPVSKPQPGDLVFYGSPAWHIGIYTGNGKMIDSPRPGKVTSERPMFAGVTGYGRF